MEARTTYRGLEPAAAVSSVLAGLDEDLFTELRLGAPGVDHAGGLWMYATVDVPSTADVRRAEWEVDLAQGAVAEEVAAVHGVRDLAQAVSGTQARLVLPDGSIDDDGLWGAGDVAAGQQFAAQASGVTDDAVVASVRAALDRFDLRPTSVRVLRPLGPAVSVVARTDDVETLRGRWDDITSAVLGEPHRYEGLYLEIDDADGAPLATGTTACRSGAGSVSFAPGMDELFGIAHGGTPEPDATVSGVPSAA